MTASAVQSNLVKRTRRPHIEPFVFNIMAAPIRHLMRRRKHQKWNPQRFWADDNGTLVAEETGKNFPEASYSEESREATKEEEPESAEKPGETV